MLLYDCCIQMTVMNIVTRSICKKNFYLESTNQIKCSFCPRFLIIAFHIHQMFAAHFC